VSISIQRSNQIRGQPKTFSLIVPNGKRRVVDDEVMELLSGNDDLIAIILPCCGGRGYQSGVLSLGGARIEIVDDDLGRSGPAV